MRARPAIGRKASLLVLALVLAVSLLAVYASFVAGAPSLKVEILSWNHIGIDNNEPDKLDPNGNPIGPDQNLVQARITNDGTDPITNAFARFQWTSANSYVRLADYETYIQHIGNLAPGEYVDVFFQVAISRTILAHGTTRAFSVTATSTETTGIASQTLIVEALAEQGSSSSVIVSAPSTVVLGDTFEVVVQAQVTRNMTYETLPLQFDRSFFSLEQVRLDFYGTNDWSGPM
jgi:hypothetical protein